MQSNLVRMGRNRKSLLQLVEAIAVSTFPFAFAAGTPAMAQADAPSSPFTIDATATVDGVANVSGGDRRDARLLAKGEFRIAYDGTATPNRWLSGLFDVGVMNGKSISGAVIGDIQGVDNIEAVRAFRIFNAWIGVSGSRAGAKAGIIDFNVDFDEQTVGALFFNSSHGVGPELSHSGLNGPSIYPNSTLGLVAWLYDGDKDLKVRLGVFNGRPNDPDHPARTVVKIDSDNGALLVGEIDKTTKRWRAAVGAWHYTSLLPVLGTDASGRGSSGAFVTVEPVLVQIPDGLELRAWGRAGLAARKYNNVRGYIGGGIVADHIWKRASEDSLGFAVARAYVNPRLDVQAGAETTFEATYQHKLAGWLFAQPDIQYVVHPGGLPSGHSALVLGMRLVATRSLQ